MIFLTIAVALSAWLIYNSHSGPSPVKQAAELREFIASNFSVSQPIHVKFGDRGLLFPDLVKASQLQLDYRLTRNSIPFKYELVDDLPRKIERLYDGIPERLVGEMVLTDDGNPSTITTSASELPKQGSGSDDTKAEDLSSAKNASSPIPKYSVELTYRDVAGVWVDLVHLKVYMSYNLDYVHQNDLPFYVTQTVFDILLQPDLTMWDEMNTGTRHIEDVKRNLKVNFVAAEESSFILPELQATIEDHFKRYESISSYVNVETSIELLDVSKKRAAPHLLRNSSDEITFFYSTSLRPYANSIQGVPLYHLSPASVEKDIEGDQFGTEYQERLKKSQTKTYNVTSFLAEASEFIEEAILFPKTSFSNLRLKADVTMKHYTIKGLVETLDILINQADHINEKILKSIYGLVDTILIEREHDWAEHLTVVTSLYNSAKVI